MIKRVANKTKSNEIVIGSKEYKQVKADLRLNKDSFIHRSKYHK